MLEHPGPDRSEVEKRAGMCNIKLDVAQGSRVDGLTAPQGHLQMA